MPALAAIVREALTAVLKGWRSLGFVLLLRAAAGVAGVFCFVLVGAALLRLVLIAPPVAAGGESAFLETLLAFLQTPRALLGLSGALVAALGLIFLLDALLDAGLWGELALALKQRRAPTFKGMANQALLLFVPAALIKLYFLALNVLLLAGLAGIRLFFSQAILPAFFPGLGGLPHGLLEAAIILGTLLIAAAGSLVFYLYSSACLAALAAERGTAGRALARGGRFFTRHALTILILYTFFFSLGLIWAGARIGGLVWAAALANAGHTPEWLGAAARAWDLTFALMGALAGMAAQASQIKLFLDEEDGESIK